MTSSGAAADNARVRSWPWFQLVLVLLGSALVLLVVAPLAGMFVTTSLGDLTQAAADEQVRQSMRLTLACALGATVACTVTGVPLGYLLARKRFFGRAVLMAVIDLPIIIPHSAAGIALLTVIGRRTWLGQVTGGLVGTAVGISVAMAFVSAPFLVNASYSAFSAVPPRLERAARTLGASPMRVFFTISLPIAWRDVVAGMILMWGRGISEFGAVVIIAYYPMTTPTLVFQRFNDFGLSYARSAAALLILVCVAIFIVLRLVVQRRVTSRHNA